MKKSLLALAVLGAFAGAASAQSSVTLFGVVDLSANVRTTNGQRLVTMDSNQLNSNRLGFKGTEDLGGGMSASFWLEGGMSNDLGTGAATGGGFNFNRRSTMSLSGSFGEVRFGHDYAPSFWTTATMDVFGANGIAEFDNLALSDLGSGATTIVRLNNSAAYFLPGNLGGLYGRVSIAPSEGVNGQKYAGFQLGWTGAGIEVVGSYGATKFNAGPDFKLQNIAASYDFGVAKVFAMYNESVFDPLKEKTEGVGVSVPLGAGQVAASYVKAKYEGAATGATKFVGSANQIGGQYLYNLSKRTAIYATVARVSNSGGATFGLGNLAVAANQSEVGYNVGLRHAF